MTGAPAQARGRMRSPLLAERPPLARLAAWPAYRWLVVGTVCVGAFLGQLDASIAGLILPTLEEVFGSTVASVEWVAIAYLLTLAALVVPLGRLADLLGRKTLYTWGFLVFIAGSALCGLAPSLAVLVGFRVVQAVGAAMLQANSAESLVRNQAEQEALTALELVARIQQHLLADHDLGMSKLGVRSETGAIVLEGDALADEDRARAEAMARSLAPQIALDNRIVVHPPTTA
jgi:hypothetical protein